MNATFSTLPPGAKCTRCKAHPDIRLPSHHANLCNACFLHYFSTAVMRALKALRFPRNVPVLVAVSGGKDSLALWQVLHDLGYETQGIHVNLGIEEFSDQSVNAIKTFAERRGLKWKEYSLKEVFGYSLYEVKKKTRRKICSICGSLKRQVINRLTIQEGFRIIATGHNLDDEAGRLLGNMIRHRTQYLEKQYPFLPASHPRMPAKVKPLYRVEESEIRIYCKLKNIDPLDKKCPFSRGATSHFFKEALNHLEEKMPGTKRDFLFTFVKQRKPPSDPSDLGICARCGEPTYGELCSVCNLLEQLQTKKQGKA